MIGSPGNGRDDPARDEPPPMQVSIWSVASALRHAMAVAIESNDGGQMAVWRAADRIVKDVQVRDPSFRRGPFMYACGIELE